MKNQIVEELWNSKCSFDLKKEHFWEKIGVISDGSDLELIWRCTQCKQCLIEPLIFLEIGEDIFRETEEQENTRKTIDFFLKQVKDHTKISRRKFYSILHQVYYLAQKELKRGKQ